MFTKVSVLHRPANVFDLSSMCVILKLGLSTQSLKITKRDVKLFHFQFTS